MVKSVLIGCVFLMCSFANVIAQSYTKDIPVVNTEEMLEMLKKADDTIRVFNFWATWCKPCVAELPYFEALHSEKQGSPFVLYLVSLDFPEVIESKLKPFLHKKHIQSQVVVFDGGDPNVWIDAIDKRWSGSIPASIVTYKNQQGFAERQFKSTKDINQFIITSLN